MKDLSHILKECSVKDIYYVGCPVCRSKNALD